MFVSKLLQAEAKAHKAGQKATQQALAAQAKAEKLKIQQRSIRAYTYVSFTRVRALALSLSYAHPRTFDIQCLWTEFSVIWCSRKY
jgi:hypothetical protein